MLPIACNEKTVEDVEQKLFRTVTTEFKVEVKYRLILHGLGVCAARILKFVRV